MKRILLTVLMALTTFYAVAQAPLQVATFPVFRAFDSNGKPLAGGKLFSYAAGTTTPLATYTDATGATPNTNPTILDSTGTARVFLGQSVSYKFVLQNQFGVQQWTVDNIVGTAAASVVLSPTGSQTIVQPTGTSFNVNVINNTVYSNNYATLQLAVAAACNGTVPGSVVLPVGNIAMTALLVVPSNCTITGQGPQTTVSGQLITTGGTNVLLKSFTVQGSTGDCIDITSPANNVTLDGIDVNTCANQGILVIGNGVSNINIRNGSVSKAGRSIATGLGTDGIIVSTGTITNVSITNERVHDNAGGISIVNSGVAGQDVSSVNISDNFIYNNAFDGVLITIGNPLGGNINSVRVENNEIYCNGWPTSGIGFSPNCTPGFFQNGTQASGSGVAVDIIQQQGLTILRPIITGNQMHDNTYEAVAATTVYNPNVNTSGTAVTWVSGPKFNTNWSPGQWVIITGTSYQIAAVPSNISMTLMTSAGTQSNVITTMSAYMGAIISNNWSYNNGGGNSGGPFPGGSVGPGFYNASSDGNTYSGNITEHSWLDGYINFYSSFLTYNGDMSFSDGRGAIVGSEAGFNNIGGFGVSYNGVVVGTHDIATPVGFFVANSQNTSITTAANTATAPLTNTGLNTSYANLAEVKPATITPSAGATVVCSTGFVCTNRSGALAVTGGAFTTGSFVTLSWPATQQVRACTVYQNSGPTYLSIGLNPIPTTTGFGVGAGVSIAGQTFTVTYNCPIP